MPEPFLCAAGKTLREQINGRWPSRDKRSDGWIGDPAHAARRSDHNPDPVSGVVRALDIDADLGGYGATALLADQLRSSGDRRLAYLIYAGRIASAERGWTWRRYSGPNPHDTHLHVSFSALGDSDGALFLLPIFTTGTLPPTELARGAQGADVRALQAAIFRLYAATGRRFPALSIALDGDFGPRTDAAVRALQGLYALPVTGVVTPELRAALDLP